MNKLNELFSDGDGQPSMMRVLVLLIVGAIMTVWVDLSIKAGRMLPIDWSQIAALGAALGFKSVQSFAENLGAASGSPSLPTDAASGGNVPTVLSAAPLSNSNARPSGSWHEQGGHALPQVLFMAALSLIAVLSIWALTGCTTTSTVTATSTVSTNSDGTYATNTTYVTNTTSTVNVTNVAAIGRTVVAAGVAYAVSQDTNTVSDFKLGYVAFQSVFASDSYSVTNISAALDSAGVTNAATKVAIVAGANAVKAALSTATLSDSQWLYLLTELDYGIRDGLVLAGYTVQTTPREMFYVFEPVKDIQTH
jgi:hypothetical protein